MAKRLTNKQRVFIAEYLRCWNATKAAIAAGYSKRSAQEIGSETLSKPMVDAEIKKRLTEIQMGTDEALARLTDMGRGDIGDLVDDNGLLDLRLARQKSMTRLIRKIKQKTITRIGKSDDDDDVEITEIEFELYSAKDAIDTILRVGGKIKDNVININGLAELLDKAYGSKPSDNPGA